MMDCLKILIVTAMYPHAGHMGSGAFVMQQVEELRSRGHRVEVFHFRGYESKWRYLEAIREVRRLTSGARYDVVHAHYGLTGFVACFRNHAPLVITLHGSDMLMGWLEPKLSRMACRFADAVIAVSDRIADMVPGSRLVPCGVNLNGFKPYSKSLAREKLELDRECRYVLFPFDPARAVKRYDLASRSVEMLKQDGMKVELLSISKVPNEEMPWYYSASDAMILCSDSEGSPTSIKEALACGLRVVSVDVGDVKEVLRGIEGVVVCEREVGALRDGLRKVLLEESNKTFLGREAMERYSQERVGDCLESVYREAILRYQGGVDAATVEAKSSVGQ